MAKTKEPEQLEPNYFGELVSFAIREAVPFALKEFLGSIFSPIFDWFRPTAPKSEEQGFTDAQYEKALTAVNAEGNPDIVPSLLAFFATIETEEISEQLKDFVEEFIKRESIPREYLFLGTEGATSYLVKFLSELNTHFMREISITKLDLTGYDKTELKDLGISAQLVYSWLAQMIRQKSSITEVNLAGMDIGHAGAKAIALALKMNTSITALDLSNNNIGNKGAKHIANALKANTETAIKTLNLYGNNIGDRGKRAIADALQGNRTMTRLTFQHDSNKPKSILLLDAIRQGIITQNKNITYYNGVKTANYDKAQTIIQQLFEYRDNEKWNSSTISSLVEYESAVEDLLITYANLSKQKATALINSVHTEVRDKLADAIRTFSLDIIGIIKEHLIGNRHEPLKTKKHIPDTPPALDQGKPSQDHAGPPASGGSSLSLDTDIDLFDRSARDTQPGLGSGSWVVKVGREPTRAETKEQKSYSPPATPTRTHTAALLGSSHDTMSRGV